MALSTCNIFAIEAQNSLMPTIRKFDFASTIISSYISILISFYMFYVYYVYYYVYRFDYFRKFSYKWDANRRNEILVIWEHREIFQLFIFR